MKHILILVAVMLFSICLIACGNNEKAEGNNSAVMPSEGNQQKVTANDFVEAFRDVGYQIVENNDAPENDINELIDGVTNLSSYNFYRNSVSEERGFFYFLTLFDGNAAKDAYAEVVNAYKSDGVTMIEMSNANRKKAFCRDALTDKFGSAYYVSQRENTLVLVVTGWDIDGDGKYENTPSEILENLGY